MLYWKRTPKQRNGLIYGAKLRCIGAIQGLLNAHWFQDSEICPFTQDEIRNIRGICQNAQRRAKEEFEANKRKLDTTEAETNSGIASESREYSGK